VAEERLFILRPWLESDPVVRTMVVSEEIKDLIEGPWEDISWEERCNKLRADLEEFVKGSVLAVSLTPHRHKTAYMGRLKQPRDEVWDIRSRDPKPSLRVFGRFADRDIFVALFWSPRSVKIPHTQRLPLGDRHSIQWNSAIRECKAEWRKLFPTYEPIHGEHHDVYLTNAFAV